MQKHPPLIRLPLVVLGSLALQAGGALWWAAQQGTTIHYHDVRLDAVESQLSDQRQHQLQLDRQVLDRLTRVEERLSAQYTLLSDFKTDRADRSNEPRRHP